MAIEKNTVTDKDKYEVHQSEIFNKICEGNNFNRYTKEADIKRFYRTFNELFEKKPDKIHVDMINFLFNYINPIYIDADFRKLMKRFNKNLPLSKDETEKITKYINDCIETLPNDEILREDIINQFSFKFCRDLDNNIRNIIRNVNDSLATVFELKSYEKASDLLSDYNRELDELNERFSKKVANEIELEDINMTSSYDNSGNKLYSITHKDVDKFCLLIKKDASRLVLSEDDANAINILIDNLNSNTTKLVDNADDFKYKSMTKEELLHQLMSDAFIPENIS